MIMWGSLCWWKVEAIIGPSAPDTDSSPVDVSPPSQTWDNWSGTTARTKIKVVHSYVVPFPYEHAQAAH